MKKIKFLMLALVAALALGSCNDDCDHNFIEYDYSEALVGTWTYIAENGQAEAMVINSDGSFAITGIMKGGYLYEEKGTIEVENNKVSLLYEGETEAFEGRLELVAGKSMSIVFFNDDYVRLTYDYCKEDLSEEIVGMWVCTYVPWMNADMAINVYQADGKAFFTGFVGDADFDYASNVETTYKVIGNLMIQSNPMSYEGAPEYLAFRMDYSPKGSEYGDVLTNTNLMVFGDETIKTTASMIRIKQNLDLPGNKYDYRATYVTNVKGEDKDIPFLNTLFNFAKMDGSIIDKFLKSTLFAVEFPDANTLKYSFLVNGQTTPMTAPIEVEGNKMTIKMSANGAAYQDVVVYTFQDQDNTQMHLYMPTSSFEKFFANTSVYVMLGNGQLDANDTEAIAGVYKTVADAVESINLSIVMTKSTKAI